MFFLIPVMRTNQNLHENGHGFVTMADFLKKMAKIYRFDNQLFH